MNWESVWRRVRRSFYVRLAAVLVSCFVVGTVGMYFAERSLNSDFATIGDAFWSSTVYVLSGFEDRPPITTGGRVISIFVFVASIGVIGGVAGKVASILLRKERIEMPRDLTNHILICNWNERGDNIIKELHASDAEPDTELIVVCKDKPPNETELRKTFKAYERAYFVESDPQFHEVLKAARVYQAKGVLILADEESPDPDAKSALIALAIKRICDDLGVQKPRIVAEVKNHRKIEHLKDAGTDEVICAADFGLGILAQSILHARLSDVYNRLLSYGPETNELYMVEGDRFPHILVGKTFKEAVDVMNRNRSPDNPVILLGIRRGNEIILNPKESWSRPEEEIFETFQESDAVIVMAFSLPDLSQLAAD